MAYLFLGEWEYREVHQDEATQLPVEQIGTKNCRKDMFRAELRLIEYPGNYLIAMFIKKHMWFVLYIQYSYFWCKYPNSKKWKRNYISYKES